MNKKKYKTVTMKTIVLPSEDIVSTSGFDRTAFDLYGFNGWVDENMQTKTNS